MRKSKGKPISSDEAMALTKAVVRAADRLEISLATLAAIIGLSKATVSRMRRGSYVLKPGRGKAFELAELFLRLYEALDAMVLSDERAASAWLMADNSTLQSRPIDLIQRAKGLADVLGYLRARRS